MAKMINVLRFRIDGFIAVDPADPANVAAASEAYNQLLTDVWCRSIVTGSGCTFSRMRPIGTGADEAEPPATTPQGDLDIPPHLRREPDLSSEEQPADDDPLTLLSAG